MAELTAIEGLGDYLAKKLVGNGVANTEELLERGGTEEGFRRIVERCDRPISTCRLASLCP